MGGSVRNDSGGTSSQNPDTENKLFNNRFPRQLTDSSQPGTVFEADRFAPAPRALFIGGSEDSMTDSQFASFRSGNQNSGTHREPSPSPQYSSNTVGKSKQVVDLPRGSVRVSPEKPSRQMQGSLV